MIITRRAFTLIEMIIVIAIVGLLMAMLLPSLAGARDAGNQADELNRLRQVGIGWNLYSSSYNDRLLPGYLDESMQERWRTQWKIRYDGSDVPRAFAAPYPWRLLPYMDENHLLLMRYNDEVSDVPPQAIAEVALAPGFGYNAFYLGGWYEGYDETQGRYIVKFEASGQIARGITELRRSENLVVFATSSPQVAGARFSRLKRNAPGSHFIVPPIVAQTPQWSGADGVFEILSNNPAPAPRWTTQIPIFFADGHTGTEGPIALTDQRRWLPRADAADFTHPP